MNTRLCFGFVVSSLLASFCLLLTGCTIETCTTARDSGGYRNGRAPREVQYYTHGQAYPTSVAHGPCGPNCTPNRAVLVTTNPRDDCEDWGARQPQYYSHSPGYSPGGYVTPPPPQQPTSLVTQFVQAPPSPPQNHMTTIIVANNLGGNLCVCDVRIGGGNVGGVSLADNILLPGRTTSASIAASGNNQILLLGTVVDRDQDNKTVGFVRTTVSISSTSSNGMDWIIDRKDINWASKEMVPGTAP